MNPLTEISTGNLRWPHLQRLAARWWRRWVYAVAAWLLGLLLMALAQPEVRENHAQAEQAVARLQQQLAALPVTASKPSVQGLTSDVQRRLASLPTVMRQGQLWTDWQQVLAAHGLRLISLRPLATEPATAPKSVSGGAHQRAKLTHQAAVLRIQGRFADWTKAWVACAETGPLCTIDRISVVGLAQAAEVQIDVVMRIWMRPDEAGDQAEPHKSAEVGGSQVRQAIWSMPSSVDPQPRAGPTLFAVNAAANSPSAGKAAGGEDSVQPTGSAAAGTSAVPQAQEDLPSDPRHWPLARVRWMGLWQQGEDRQAILSAGTHWAKVSEGQRVTQEGHRVLAITDSGVSLRLARQTVIKLDGLGPAADGQSMGSEKR